jgi:energy-coupling factor transport system permease protein
MKQPWAWVTWLIVTVVILSTTRNPLYLVQTMLCIVFVGLSLHSVEDHSPLPFPVYKLAAWIIVLATCFNALTSHYGTTVLFTIPGRLPILSGPVTLEAAVYGATNGLILTGMLACFMVLNLALTVRELVSLIPQAFFPVAVVTSIAVTYIPTTIRQFKQIREAQSIRGHQMRTLRDWLPLWMPLMVGGLEHAMQLAEAMTARGFASKADERPGAGTYPRLAMLLGLVLVSLGWVLQLGGVGVSGLVLILAGAGVIGGAVWQLSRKVAHTAYHRVGWGLQDWLGIAISITVLAICVLPIPGLNHEVLYYDPYPTLTIPLFDPWIGVALLGLLAPGVFRFAEKPGEEKIGSELPGTD